MVSGEFTSPKPLVKSVVAALQPSSLEHPFASCLIVIGGRDAALLAGWTPTVTSLKGRILPHHRHGVVVVERAGAGVIGVAPEQVIHVQLVAGEEEDLFHRHIPFRRRREVSRDRRVAHVPGPFFIVAIRIILRAAEEREPALKLLVELVSRLQPPPIWEDVRSAHPRAGADYCFRNLS